MMMISILLLNLLANFPSCTKYQSSALLLLPIQVSFTLFHHPASLGVLVVMVVMVVMVVLVVLVVMVVMEEPYSSVKASIRSNTNFHHPAWL